MTTSTTMRAMRYGQHAITLVLLAFGLVRALLDGAAPALLVFVSACFLAWYIAGSLLARRLESRPLAAVWLVGLAALWLALTITSVEFVWLAFPLWLLAGHLLSLRTALAFSILVFAAVVVVPMWRTGETSYAYLVGPLVGGVFAFGISRGYLQLLEDARERQHLIASLVQAQHDMAGLHEELGRAQRESGAIQERTRLSRDIHDTIAQGLSAIALTTRAGSGKGLEESQRSLQAIQALAVENLGEVRRIVNALAPAELDEAALAAALRRMLDKLTEETGIHTELHADTTLPILPGTVEVALLRTAQSALSNIRLHAEASRIVVNLIDAEDAVRLDIVDDGHGFDVRALGRASGGAASGYGLHSMRERLRELGGGLDIESARGEGTALSAYLPLGPHAERPDEGMD